MNNEPNAVRVARLIDEQKKKFASAHTTNGVVYFNLIGKMIKSGDIRPPRGMQPHHLQEAYDQALILVGKKEYEKSAKKNRQNEKKAAG